MFYDEEERWAVCVHEAAHAVVASLGGKDVYEIAVAPVGSGEWDRDYDEYDKMRKSCPSCRLLPHVRCWCGVPISHGGTVTNASIGSSGTNFPGIVRDHFPRCARDEFLRQLRAQVCI